jgi:hypothetical protein
MCETSRVLHRFMMETLSPVGGRHFGDSGALEHAACASPNGAKRLLEGMRQASRSSGGCAARASDFAPTAQPNAARPPERLTGNRNVIRSSFRVGHDDQPGMGPYVADHGAKKRRTP